MYLLLLAVVYIAFISLGLPDSLLGAAWPAIHVEFGVPLSYMGAVSMIISAGTVISGLLSERLTKKFTAKVVTITSVGLTAVAMLGFSNSKELYQLCLWSIPYGLGAGSIDAALNNYVALHYNSKHMSWLHCFWGVGTIISPYIMSYALCHTVWHDGYRAVSFLQFGILILLIVALPLWKVNENTDIEGSNREIVGIKNTLKIKGVPYVLIGFFSYCAAECTTMLWASSYFEGVIGLGKSESAALGAMFYIGLTAGRFLSGFVADKVGDNRMIRLGVCIALFGAICIAIPLKYVMIIGFIITGIGCAPIYPCIIHSTPDNFGAKYSQGIIGIQMASAYIGTTLMPPIYGLIGNYISIRLLPLYISIFFVLVYIMMSKARKVCKKNNGGV